MNAPWIHMTGSPLPMTVQARDTLPASTWYMCPPPRLAHRPPVAHLGISQERVDVLLQHVARCHQCQRLLSHAGQVGSPVGVARDDLLARPEMRRALVVENLLRRTGRWVTGVP